MSPALAEILSACRHWRRAPGGLRFVAVPLAGVCKVDWPVAAPILSRWIRGRAYALGATASDAEISAAIAALVADAAREIPPPGECERAPANSPAPEARKRATKPKGGARARAAHSSK